MRSILRRLSRSRWHRVAYLALSPLGGRRLRGLVTVTGTEIKDGTITGRDVEEPLARRQKLSAKGGQAR